MIEELEPRILLSADVPLDLSGLPPLREVRAVVVLADAGELAIAPQAGTTRHSEEPVLLDGGVEWADAGAGDTSAGDTGGGELDGGWGLEHRSAIVETAPAVGDAAQTATTQLSSSTTASAQTPALPAALAGVSPPLTFEKNAGQTAEFIDFLARGDGYTVFLENGNALIDLRHDDGGGHVVELSVTGARNDVTGIGEGALASRSNYLIGGAASHATSVDNYGAVRYAGIYDGIDLRYYGNARALEYDFIVNAGADASVIALRFDGASRVDIDDDGDLVITLDDASPGIRFHAPVSYQDAANGERAAVDSRYVLRADGSVGFQTGDYDRTRALIIDPTLSWSTYLGGTGLEEIEGVAMDAVGNVYVTGSTGSATLPATVGAYDTAIGGSRDAFVVKYNASGVVQYATYLGGSNNDWAHELDVDSAGQVYIVGETLSGNFPLVNQAYSDVNGASSDGYLVKLNAAGNAVLYSTFFGEPYDHFITAISVDDSGIAHVAGSTRATSGGQWNVLIEKIDTTLSGVGSELWWFRTGGSGDDTPHDLSMDVAGNMYVVGETYSTGLGTGSPFDSSYNGAGDGFIARYDNSGTLTYFTYVGGAGNDGLNGIVIDGNDNLYVTGWTASATGIATAGAYDTTAPSVQDAFLARFDTSLAGNAQQIFGTYYGATGVSRGAEIALDADGNVVIIGDTSGSVAVTAGALQSTSGGGNDAFIAKFNSTGTSLLYGSYLGGTNTDTLTDLVIGANGYVYVAGSTHSSGLSTAGAADTSADTTNGEGLLARMSLAQAPAVTVPGAQVTGVNTTLVFSSGGANAVTIADADAGAAVTEVSLTVTNGTLSLSGITGLNFLVGDGSGDATVTFSGTLADINAALDGLSYVPTTSYAGGAVLTVTAGDNALAALNIDVDLQGRYTFENNVNDVAPGAAPAGTSVNGAGYVTDGARGTVLNLDGTNDHVTIASTFTSPADITIGGWVHLDAATGRSEFISLDDRVHIALDEAGVGVKGSIQTGAAAWNDLTTGVFIAGTGWHHVMYTYSDSGNVHRLYIDGVQAASEVTADSIYWTGATTTYIGMHPGNLHHLNGQVDDVRVYSRALTASEVMALAADLTYVDTGTVALTVGAVNAAPVAVTDAATAVEAGGIANGTAGTHPTGNVLTNDTDADVGDTQTVTGVAAGVAGSAIGNVGSAVAGSYGSINIAADGSYTYTVNNANTTVQALANATQTLTDTFTYTMQDGGGLDSTTQITVTIQGVNDEQVLATNTGATVAEGGTVTLTNLMLAATDPDTSAVQRVFTLTSAGANGQWRLSGTALGVGDSFTQDDIDNSRVTYVHDGSETLGDTFGFDLDDGAGAVTAGTFSLTVTPVNDAPAIASNNGITVNAASAGALIGTAALSEGDPDDAGTGVTYTVTTAPAYGTLRLGGVALAAGGVFTQADVDANLLTYDHDGAGGGADAFDYLLADGGENGSTPATGTFLITVVQPAPVTTTFTPPPDAGTGDPVDGLSGGETPDAAEPSVIEPSTDTQDGESASGASRLEAALAALPPAAEREPEGESSQASGLERMTPLLNSQAATRPLMHLQAQSATQPRAENASAMDFQWAYDTAPRLASWQVAVSGGGAEITFEPPEKVTEESDSQVVAIMNPALWGGLMAGFGTAWWAGRAGVLLGSVVAGTPAWARLDPLPIAMSAGPDDGGDDEEDLEQDKLALAPAHPLSRGTGVV